MSTEAKEDSANMETEFTSLAEIEQELPLVAQRIKSRTNEHPHWPPGLFGKLDARAKYVSSGCWKHLPRGVKDALYSTSMAGVNGSSKIKNDAFVKVLIFLRRIIDDAFNDSGFDWNLYQATRSAYIIASDLLMNEDQTKAMLMIFCGAVFQECLAFSPQFTERSLKTCAPMKVVETGQGKLITFGELFLMCTFIGRAIDRTRSPKAMADFLASFLANYDDTTELANRLTDLRCDYFAGPIHSFIAHGPFVQLPHIGIDTDPVRLTLLMMCDGVTASITDGSPSTYHEFDVYRHTSINWLFNLCFSWCNGKEQMKALLGGTHTPSLGLRPRIKLAGELHYLATCGDKTLYDVGVTEDAVILFYYDRGPRVAATAAKKATSVKEKKQRRRRQQNKSNKRATAINVPNQPSSEILREQHSRAMEPVLDELRPRLKAIRDKLASQLLVKTGPKERKAKKSSVDKENVSNNVTPMFPSSAGGKAGKTFYPVLVGEPSNLHKTSRLCPRNRPRTTVLDLHGCSRDEALKRLDNGLKEWVDIAMKGHHPFIVPVDIVCGGGNQVLSQLVSKFIRENAQIANRPRGLA